MKLSHVLILTVVLSLPAVITMGQTHRETILKFQKTLNEKFLDPEESPLSKKERKNFKGHEFFPIDESFSVEARFTKTQNPIAFQMKTTTDRLPTYDKYGEAIFELNGKTFTLAVYQNHSLRETEEYKNYLFLPFTDLTNGGETYGGGRYIDLIIPDGNTIVIDFNKAYNPFCAYSYRFSCPIPPPENDMDMRVIAGIKISD